MRMKKKEIYKKNPFETFRYARVTILGEEKTVRLNDNGAFIFQNI